MNLREIRTYVDPPPGRWVVRIEIPRSVRWFEVNIPRDITTGEMEGLFVEMQEVVADRQGQLEREHEARLALTEPAGPPPLDDDDDGTKH